MALRRLISLAVACALMMAVAAPAQARSAPKKPYCVTHKCIALTFDDGPADYAETLLKILKKYKAKATFFVIGNRVKKHPKITAHIARDGHEIGNHTWDHKYLTELSYEDIYREIRDTQRIIKKATKKSPVLFRAPGGLTDEDVETATAKFGLVQIPGTVATQDFIPDYRDVEFLTTRALDIAGRDEVVLMHETVKQTVQSLPAVLKELTKQGYHFVTVSKLLEGQKLIPGRIYPEEPLLSDD
ncbi:polysaccharide deacetylase family protein [Planotetraspora sp. GP83]|uniref:polysaccharide deacetylase family protein n=1 Tax=Planotetraspora sp. GP83 TaxID=3156264 RepID=UPI00351803D4